MPNESHLKLRLRLQLLMAIGLILFAIGCEQQNGLRVSTSNQSTQTLTVNAIRISRIENATKTSTFFGTLKPNRQSQLRFTRGGRIKSLSKQIGETLKAGETIATLELNQLEAEKAALENTIQQVKQGIITNPNQGSLQQLEAQLQTLQLELDKGSILAPYDCTITSQPVHAGELVSPESPIAIVVEELPVLIEANLPRQIAQGLTDERSVWVAIGEQPVEAKVKSKSPLESTPGSRIVIFEITQPLATTDWSFGQTVEIQFIQATENSGYWLPFSALRRDATGLWSSLVITSDNNESADETDPSNNTSSQSQDLVAKTRMLKLVQLENEWALVQGALAENDLVIVDGLNRVIPGQEILANDVTQQYQPPSAGANE